MQLKHKILLFGFVFFLVILVITNSIMVGVYIQMRSEKNKLETKVTELEKEAQEFEKILNDKEQSNDDTDEGSELVRMIEYKDESQKIEFEYPSDWFIETELKLGEDLVLDDTLEEQGLIMSEFTYKLIKGNTQLDISKFYTSGFGGIGGALTEGEYDYEVLDKDVVRYKLKESKDWEYNEKTDCENLPDDVVKDAKVCVSIFFPAFGIEEYPASIKLINPSSEEIITEADKIVLSLLN